MSSTPFFRVSRPLWLAAILALSACSTLPPWMVLQGGRSRISDYQHFDSAPIAAAQQASELRFQPTDLRWPNGVSSAQVTEQLAREGTVALLVIRRGVLVHEQYFNGFARDSTGTSFSIAKSVVATLLGIAIAEGRIDSVDTPITRYLPELLRNDPRFAQISLRHLLAMRSGIAFDEGYRSPFAEAAKFYLGPSIPEQVAKLQIAGAPNQRYSYQSGDTQLLAMAIERAMGQPWAVLVQSKLWQPMGAEYSASWSLDSKASGVARAFCCLNARAVDYLRFGMLMLGEDGVPGRQNGRQIVPSDWVTQMTAAQTGLPGADESAQRNIESPGTRMMAYYAWQWRRAPALPTLPASTTDRVGTFIASERPPSNDFFAEGLHGQLLYIAPATQTVILRLGRDWGAVNWPEWMGGLARLNP
jgi:CubicO group peptidase (beta-lactamase class C family)